MTSNEQILLSQRAERKRQDDIFSVSEFELGY